MHVQEVELKRIHTKFYWFSLYYNNNKSLTLYLWKHTLYIDSIEYQCQLQTPNITPVPFLLLQEIHLLLKKWHRFNEKSSDVFKRSVELGMNCIKRQKYLYSHSRYEYYMTWEVWKRVCLLISQGPVLISTQQYVRKPMSLWCKIYLSTVWQTMQLYTYVNFSNFGT